MNKIKCNHDCINFADQTFKIDHAINNINKSYKNIMRDSKQVLDCLKN